MTETLDVLVVGDDPASLCAASVAAKAGAATGSLVLPGKRPLGVSFPSITNDLWRRLDLQDHGLSFVPLDQRITLMAGGEQIATPTQLLSPANRFRAENPHALDLWSDFINAMKGLHGEASVFLAPPVRGDGVARLADMDPASAMTLHRLFEAPGDIVRDFFSDTNLTLHALAHALGAAGFGGDESLAAGLLADFARIEAVPMRVGPDSPALLSTLRTICRKAGVAEYTGAPTNVLSDGVRGDRIVFEDGSEIRTKAIFFASPEAAAAAGFNMGAAAGADNGARALMRIKHNGAGVVAGADTKSRFAIVDTIEQMVAARDAVAAGRVPDNLPMELEIADNGDVIATSAYVPARLLSDEGERAWTGQDKQLLSQQFLTRLESRFGGLVESIKRKDLFIMTPVREERTFFERADNVISQPFRHHSISAAVSLMDKAVING